MKLEDFKKAKIVAMKAKDAQAVIALNVLINKIMLRTIEKRAESTEVTEADIVSLIQKTEKELVEECEAFEKAGRAENVEALKKQIETIRSYLPKMMSKDEILAVIETLPDKSVPAVMRYFKENYAGKCEMRAVSEALRSAK